MGNILSAFNVTLVRSFDKVSSVIENICGTTTNNPRRKRKATNTNIFPDIDTKRFKLNTLHYVYQKLFVEGQDSDVQIHALGHVWRLHRLYLEQCDYFRALFQGNWSDSGKNEYTMYIEDENICFTGLNNVFASLYNNEIEIDEEHVASVCGAASMLNLPSVLEKCEFLLADYLYNKEKLLTCLRLSDRYGFEKRMKEAINVLKYMFCHYCTDEVFLRGLQQSWLITLFSQQFVCVRGNELDLYNAVKNWIFLSENPCSNLGDDKALSRFYESESFDWRNYMGLLRLLRVSHLVTSQSSLKIITTDGIIPISLLNNVLRDQWRMLLRSEETTTGFPEVIEDNVFYASCYRFGRGGVNAYSRTNWRWSGYFFGVDLLVNYDQGYLRLTRNSTVAPTHHQISIKYVDTMKLHFRCIVCAENGHILLDTKKQSKTFNLDRNVELGKFQLPPKGQAVSIHLFCLPFAPIHQPTYYWDEFDSMDVQ
ncbi:BTB domain-containing protein [Meloidogyne graminicola]|uniref:BTB domain-containing protein n=1 Tax=Meloidogyne graminicola TaxID=189291 RepID=A0A8T0A2V3_9BILA|nr:BTB domain-containing protein [Meloidogyne graminicola]